MARSRGSEQRRSNRSSDSPPPHLRALPHWDEIEHRLRCRCTSHQVVVWHGERHPGSPQPTVRALEGFLRQKPLSWFVVEPSIGSFTPPRVPWISVLSGQATLIQIQTLRLNKLLAMEHDSGYMQEVRHAIELLNKLYDSHRSAQHAAGVESAKQPKSEAAEDDFRHPVYPFLPPDDARLLTQIQQRVASGELNPIELYRLAAPIFAVERLEQERRSR